MEDTPVAFKTPLPEFRSYPKIFRYYRPVVITEKIDGTNGVVHISEEGVVTAGSRNRWLSPEKDNHGFCAWVKQHEDKLLRLGPGYHYGEWWGEGIQRGYGMAHKAFSLFAAPPGVETDATLRVVPRLYTGPFREDSLLQVCQELRAGGSRANPGWLSPEGVVIYHVQSRYRFKYTFDGDGEQVVRTTIGTES